MSYAIVACDSLLRCDFISLLMDAIGFSHGRRSGAESESLPSVFCMSPPFMGACLYVCGHELSLHPPAVTGVIWWSHSVRIYNIRKSWLSKCLVAPGGPLSLSVHLCLSQSPSLSLTLHPSNTLDSSLSFPLRLNVSALFLTRTRLHSLNFSTSL